MVWENNKPHFGEGKVVALNPISEGNYWVSFELFRPIIYCHDTPR